MTTSIRPPGAAPPKAKRHLTVGRATTTPVAEPITPQSWHILTDLERMDYRLFRRCAKPFPTRDDSPQERFEFNAVNLNYVRSQRAAVRFMRGWCIWLDLTGGHKPGPGAAGWSWDLLGWAERHGFGDRNEHIAALIAERPAELYNRDVGPSKVTPPGRVARKAKKATPTVTRTGPLYSDAVDPQAGF